MNEPPSARPWDVVIVGGGSAGLSAALLLGRCLRRVLVLDAGRPRNAAARRFNGYLTRDHSTPAEFLQLARQEIATYETVALRQGEVREIRRTAGGFDVSIALAESVATRLVLLATGLIDELPDIPGFREIYGTTAHSCPLCDAWEHRATGIVVTGDRPEAAELALELKLWSSDIVLCSNGPLQVEASLRARLERADVRLREQPILRLESSAGHLLGVQFVDGSFLTRAALFFSPGQRQRSALADKLGCQFEDNNCIRCDDGGATCVEGVYAAGNASEGVQLVIAAAAAGARAAVAMNNALLEADGLG